MRWLQKPSSAAALRSELVLDAIGSVPREAFLPAQLRERIENSFGKNDAG
jgi:hypothetical protein